MFVPLRKLCSRIIVYGILVVALLLSQAGSAFALKTNRQANTLLDSYAIVFVSRRIPNNGTMYMAPNETGSMPGVGPYSRFQVSAPGKLVVRETTGALRILVDGSRPTSASLNLIDVNAPDVSYDGTRIVFAGLTAGSYSTAPMTDPGAWRIYVINVDGTGLRQITFSDRDNLDLSQFITLAGSFRKYDDMDPVWLPDGRIVFSSTRWPSFAQYGGARTSNLYVVNANGTGLHRITSERNSADRPLVDPITGKIVYSRWWRNFRVATNSMQTLPNTSGGYIMKDGLLVAGRGIDLGEVGGHKTLDRNAWHLATINPDGTGLAQWAGTSNTTYSGQLINHAYGGAFTADGSLYANFFPMTNHTEAAGFGGIRHYQRGPHGYTPVIGITTRDETILRFVRTNPNSYGVYQGNYAAEPEVLPDGRLIISWARDIAQDYGLYIINPDGSGRSLLYDNPGTTELRTRLIRPRPTPPIIEDQITQVASLLPPLDTGPYDRDGTFTFQALNVYFNAPVDTNILSAIPVGSAGTIRFFIDHQRWQQSGSFESLDWPILLQEVPVNPDGSISTSSPANVPLFEQIRSPRPGYMVPLTGLATNPIQFGGAAHVAGMNFGRPGETVTCVGCHAGHSMIPVPANPEEAQWTNLAPGATIYVSSLSSSLTSSKGLTDRRVKIPYPPDNLQKYWMSRAGLAPNTQWIMLSFPVPVTVRTVRLYNIPRADSSIQVQAATVKLFHNGTNTAPIASRSTGGLSENGTDVAFSNVLARNVVIEFNSVNGAVAGLGEVEVIAKGEPNLPLYAISGNTGAAGVSIRSSRGEETRTDENGNYSVGALQGWSGTVTPSHPCLTFSPSEHTYSDLRASQASQNFSFTLKAGCTRINMSIGGVQTAAHVLAPSQSSRTSYAMDNGPVQLGSASETPIIAAMRAVWKMNGQNTSSYSELMGLPAEQLSGDYYFPWYNNATNALDQQLRFGNVDTAPTTIEVTAGGQVLGTYELGPGQSTRISYPGLDNGPIRLRSLDGKKIIAAMRSVWLMSGQNSSFSELMGLPKEQLSGEYYFPWYNNATTLLDEQLRFGNVDTAPTTVEVSVGGQMLGTYPLDPGQSMRIAYPGVDDGPVRIRSTDGKKIIAAMRAVWKMNGQNSSSYSELMGLPAEQLSGDYYFPWYNNATNLLDEQFRFANLDTGSTTVEVSVGSTILGTYNLAPGESLRQSFVVDNGPVRIRSTDGKKIIAAMRAVWKLNGQYSSYSELMGLPAEQLSTAYYFPWYNNITNVLDEQFRFGVP